MNNKKNTKVNINLKENKKILLLVIAILVVILVAVCAIKTIDKKEAEKTSADVKEIVAKAETKVIYVGNSDSKKCKNCDKIKKYLDSKNINYVTYDVSKYTKKEYTEMLRTIEINPDDFGYPAVIYINEGKLYSNAINLEDTKPVEDFIKTYDLTKIK